MPDASFLIRLLLALFFSLGNLPADDLASSVAGLPANSKDEQLKKAVLQWALQESTWEHDTDYGPITTSCTQDRVVRANLLLADPQGGNGTAVHHALGLSHFYLAEIYPDTAAPAKTITRLQLPTGSKLIGFEVEDGTHHLRLIANPSTRDETYQDTIAWANAGGKLFAHRSGEQYRPSWIGDGKQSLAQPPTPVATISGTVQITIPAGAHVVLSDVE